ncbi:MAG TPA: BtrH N-terminal domain-containing protein [Candidatus Limnocylindrales bacterium]|nr:BtrH N-terminal domain-containing protein [Candidatus Limnocylindrales bacterium]
MTTHKGFKRLVRSRMSRTGERYAVARRVLLADRSGTARSDASESPETQGGYRFRGGLHPETACLTNVLADRGLTSPLTGQPLSEGLVLVAGGGLGAGYILWEFANRGTILTLGFRNRWQYPGIPGWYGNATERLGVEARLHETAGARSAAATLDAILERGEPVIAFIDLQEIGTWGQPARLSGSWGYPVVVTGRAPDGAYLVDDRGRTPLHVDAAVLARARARIGSFRHRLIELRPTPGPVPVDRLRAALRAGLDDQVDHLRSRSDSFSLPAWRKWSRLMTDPRHAKGWPRVFAGGAGLFGGLMSIVEEVDGDVGATGGNLRELLAGGLDEAATVLDLPGLVDAAAAWRGAADLWHDLADAAVPASIDGAADALEAAEELHDAVMAGEADRATARAAAHRLWEARDRGDRARLADGLVDGLFADLADRLRAIHAAEVEALEITARAIGR